jgi:PBP1b-binding outer membrane lipoprotein LpoB
VKKLLSAILISSLLLSGCSAKEDLIKETKASNNAHAAQQPSTSERVEVNTDFKAVTPGTIPELSETLKSEVEKNFKPTIADLKDAMKSIQDAQDIDLDSIK